MNVVDYNAGNETDDKDDDNGDKDKYHEDHIVTVVKKPLIMVKDYDDNDNDDIV